MNSTASEVAFELVATKLAIAELVDTICGTTPGLATDTANEAIMEWAYTAPVRLPFDPGDPGPLNEAHAERLWNRSTEIQAEILAACGAYLTACAAHLRAPIRRAGVKAA